MLKRLAGNAVRAVSESLGEAPWLQRMAGRLHDQAEHLLPVLGKLASKPLTIGGFRPPTVDTTLTADEQKIVDEFHCLYYRRWQEGKATIDLSFMGYQTLKCPMDMWIYQELLFEQQPDFIIECGTHKGGSAYYFAAICQLLGKGRVLSIDIEEYPDRPQHDRITYLRGMSTEPQIVDQVRALVGPARNVLVILDSCHTKNNVLSELQVYKDFVPVGGSLIVEDTNIYGHPVRPELGPGPMEALDEWLPTNPNFVIDSSRERFLMTLFPRGFLRRIA